MARYQDFPPLTLERALSSLVLVNLLLMPIAFFLPALSGMANAAGCLERIRTYLNSPAQEQIPYVLNTPESSVMTPFTNPLNYENPDEKHSEISVEGQEDCIAAQNASCGWGVSKDPILNGMNFTIREGDLTMIVGPVGSGKSTLLRAFLGETPVINGLRSRFRTSVAYCGQVPWLISGTIKENIVHASPYEDEWYKIVVEACALEADLRELPLGSDTVLSSKGSSLSGGQQHRVALARAVYSRRRIVIIDDVLCGLDAKTEGHVFKYVFGKDGLLRKAGSTVVFVTNGVHRLGQADHIIALADNTIIQQGTLEDLCRQGGYVSGLTRQKSEDEQIETQENKLFQPTKQDTTQIKMDSVPSKSTPNDTATFLYFIRTVGVGNWCIFCCFCAIYGFAMAFPSVWVKWWGMHNEHHPNTNIQYYLSIYAALPILEIGSLVLICWMLVMRMAPNAGRTLHQRLVTSVLDAPMVFFTSTDTGTIINRFSQDLELIDMELPPALIRTSMVFFATVAQLFVVLASAKYVGLAIPAAIIVTYFLSVYYLRTSRRLRILDIESKALLGTQFMELLSGLITVRAFRWQEHHVVQFVDALKQSQKPYYLLHTLQRWLNMVLDLIVGSIAVLLVIVAVAAKQAIDPDMTALALTVLVGFSALLRQLITNWTLLEISMGALSRIRDFTTSVASEHLADENSHVPKDWPSSGRIVFHNASFKHNETTKTTLNNINLEIPAGTRVGIVGRSGSGKSSLISTLLRLMEIESGHVTVDGIDISNVPREVLRSRVITVSQEPCILPGTVRENVDPLAESSDEEIIAALQKTHLGHLLDESSFGLNSSLSPDSLSPGQCQLLSLARAIIRQSSILILDEATAYVDVRTDSLMQEIIRTEFKNHTIIAAAHRLNTIADFDAVIVMDGGYAVEYDSPQALLAKRSIFREFWRTQRGSQTLNVAQFDQ